MASSGVKINIYPLIRHPYYLHNLERQLFSFSPLKVPFHRLTATAEKPSQSLTFLWHSVSFYFHLLLWFFVFYFTCLLWRHQACISYSIFLGIHHSSAICGSEFSNSSEECSAFGSLNNFTPFFFLGLYNQTH